MLSLGTHPADQFGLSEVFYTPYTYLGIHCGAPFLVGLQVNQPYFFITSVRYHNLLWTDHFSCNIPKIFTFHFLPKQGISVAVSVEKKYATLSNVLNALLSLLLQQKHESIVKGSEHIANIFVPIFEADGNRFFLKHKIQSINIYDLQIRQTHLYHISDHILYLLPQHLFTHIRSCN